MATVYFAILHIFLRLFVYVVVRISSIRFEWHKRTRTNKFGLCLAIDFFLYTEKTSSIVIGVDFAWNCMRPLAFIDFRLAIKCTQHLRFKFHTQLHLEPFVLAVEVLHTFNFVILSKNNMHTETESQTENERLEIIKEKLCQFIV